MNILYTLNSGNQGGMEQHVLDLVSQMHKRGHNVFVWCNKGPIVKWYQDVGAKVFIKKVLVTFGIDIDPKYILDLIKFLKQNKIDVVHCHELRAVGNTRIAAVFAKTKVSISHIHTPFSEWPVSPIKKKIYTFSYKIASKLFPSVEIALTQSRKRVKIREGLNEKDLVVIPNGVDLNQFTIDSSKKLAYKTELLEKYNIAPDTFIFGNISRTTQEKDHETLIRAFVELFEYKETRDQNIHLLIGGGGVLEDSLREFVARSVCPDNITITGRFAQEDLSKLYSAMDAFVFPSKAEGFGLVLIEAMTVGLPIICSNLEVLQEVGGSAVFSYFEVGDHTNLALKMHELYMKRNNLQNIVDNAYERVNTLYSIEKFGTNYENLYKDLLEHTLLGDTQ